jgi:nucleoside-diphosphate-sugar epimerase
MNALVTGATGFIGSPLVKELVREQHPAKALVLLGKDVSALETQGVTVWRGDLSKRESLAASATALTWCFILRRGSPTGARFGVYIMGRDYDVDTALTQMQLGWKTKVPYEDAMERIGEWGEGGALETIDSAAATGAHYAPGGCDEV